MMLSCLHMLQLGHHRGSEAPSRCRHCAILIIPSALPGARRKLLQERRLRVIKMQPLPEPGCVSQPGGEHIPSSSL